MSDDVLKILIVTVPPTITGIATLVLVVQSKKVSLDNSKKIDVVHDNVNSKMTELLEVTAKAAKSEGKLEEIQKQEEKK